MPIHAMMARGGQVNLLHRGHSGQEFQIVREHSPGQVKPQPDVSRIAEAAKLGMMHPDQPEVLLEPVAYNPAQIHREGLLERHRPGHRQEPATGQEP